jgi:hypothetical protein
VPRLWLRHGHIPDPKRSVFDRRWLYENCRFHGLLDPNSSLCRIMPLDPTRLSLTARVEHVKLDKMAIRTAAIILLFSVLLVFFVPAGAGPFSAVHGPATALRANRAAQVFYVSLALSARCPIAAEMISLAAQWAPRSHALLAVHTSSPLCPLRC